MEVAIGLLSLWGEQRKEGGHVQVQVRGVGAVGSRPLCGQVVLSDQEWKSLVDLADRMKRLKDDNDGLLRELANREGGFS